VNDTKVKYACYIYALHLFYAIDPVSKASVVGNEAGIVTLPIMWVWVLLWVRSAEWGG
jgi:hypothetical protein